MAEIARLSTNDADFASRLDALLAWESVSDDQVQQTVVEVIKAVRTRGDVALLDYTARFDGWRPRCAASRRGSALQGDRSGADCPTSGSAIPSAAPA